MPGPRLKTGYNVFRNLQVDWWLGVESEAGDEEINRGQSIKDLEAF